MLVGTLSPGVEKALSSARFPADHHSCMQQDVTHTEDFPLKNLFKTLSTPKRNAATITTEIILTSLEGVEAFLLVKSGTFFFFPVFSTV